MPAHRLTDKARRGSTVVEASFILLMLMMILLGIFDFGMALFEYSTLMNKARSAARYAALHPSDVTGIKNVALYDSPSLPAGKSDGDPGAFGLTPSMVSVARFDQGKPEDRIVVGLSGYTMCFVTPYIAGTFKGRSITVTLPTEALP